MRIKRGRAYEGLCVLSLVGLIGCDRQPAPEAAAVSEPPASSPASPEPDAAAPQAPPRPAGPAGLLGRPSAPAMPAPGESSTQPEGCLARAPQARAESAQTRSAPQAPSAPVTLTPRADGVRIVSAFEHNCCHTARTEVEVSEARVRVVHHLSGESCRCMCSSSLTTQVGLEPGRYAVEVEAVAQGGAPIVSERQEVVITAAP